MATDQNKKVALALLDEVEQKIDKLLGNIASLPPGAEYNSKYDVDGGELIEQCEQAMKKLDNDQAGMAKANFLLGRLYAVRTKPGWNRQMLKAAEYYQKAIELGYDETEARYYLALHKESWNKKQEAINNFQRIVDLTGVDSEAGLEAAKQIEKIKAESKGGCFIATAVYDLAQAPEVETLRQFRDEVLLKSKIGKFFVAVYYRISPPLALVISRSKTLKMILRSCILEPIVKLIRN